MSRPIHAHIDQNALECNLRMARNVAPFSRIMAVIKADGYGHGLMRVAKALSGAEGFGLLDIGDALQLREAGYRQTLLLLEGCFDTSDVALAVAHDVTCVVHSAWQIAMLDACPERGALDVWLKVNSGMNRLGFAPGEVAQAMERLRSHRAVRNITLMAHFANADDDICGIAEPLALFNDIASNYRCERSLSNSAALLRYPEAHGDWVRPGLMLYGASPFAKVPAHQLGLKPAMYLGSSLIAVQELRAGEEVGYGAMFRAERDIRIGIAACGYADGYPRHAPTGTPVLVDGQRTQALGRVSMDMLCVDLSALPQAGIGSQVTLWGEGLPVEEVARAAGTISYELMCALAPRVPIDPK